MEFYTSVARYGNSILYRGYKNGHRVMEKVPFSPTLFTLTDRETGYKTLDGAHALPKTFDTMRDAQEFIKQYDGMDFPILGNTNYVAQFIQERFPGQIKWDPSKITISTIDIEVASDNGFPFPELAEKPIISITLWDTKSKRYRVWGLYDYDVDKSIKAGEVDYVWCETEVDLLMDFLRYWNDPLNTPDIITGWNSKLFDMVYIVNRVKRVLGDKHVKKLSPWGLVNERSVRMMNKEIQSYDVVGVMQLDYLDLFKKFGYKYGAQESYKLDHIGHVVLGERKLSYEEHGSLYTLYKEDFQKFLDYNIKDVELVVRMEDKTGLIALALTMAYKAGVNPDQTFGTTSIWDSFIYRTLTESNIVVPPNEMATKTDLGGGYVKDPEVGRHDWVCSFDLNSLYPHLILQYNMSPETIIDKQIPDVTIESILAGETINNTEYAMAATGQCFKRDVCGFLPNMIQELYAERKQIKQNMLQYEQELVNIKDEMKKRGMV